MPLALDESKRHEERFSCPSSARDSNGLFGIVFAIWMELVVLKPLQSVAPEEISLMDITLGMVPFMGPLFVLLDLLIAMPGLAIWLVGHMRT